MGRKHRPSNRSLDSVCLILCHPTAVTAEARSTLFLYQAAALLPCPRLFPPCVVSISPQDNPQHTSRVRDTMDNEKYINETQLPDSAPEHDYGRKRSIHTAPLDATPKSRWERSWPTIACGSGLFSDGYLNGYVVSLPAPCASLTFGTV